MYTVRLSRMYRNARKTKCQWGHDWAYIKAGKEKNYGTRICRGCSRSRPIKDFAAAMKARERRTL